MDKRRRGRRQTDEIDDTAVEGGSVGMQQQRGSWCNVAFKEFQEECETWDSFVGRLENYFAIMSIETNNVKKTQILIQTMGVNTYQQLCDHLSPEKPSSRGYGDLIKCVERILNPRPSVITEQYNFTCRKQREGESIKEYLCDLKRLAKYCCFSCIRCNASTQEAHIQQQFIAGLRDKNILKELLKTHKTMTLTECTDLAFAMERASEEADIIQGKESVSIMSGKNSEANEGHVFKCFGCGSTKHRKSECPFRTAVCYKCKKVGHISKVCRGQLNRGQAKLLDTDKNQESTGYQTLDEHDISIGQLTSLNLPEMFPKPKRIMITCKIEDKFITFEYDTGSTVSTISADEFQRNFPHKKMEKTGLILKTYTGESIKPLGYVSVDIKVNDAEARGNVYVLPGIVQPIFGREWMVLLKTNVTLNKIEDIDEKTKEKLLTEVKVDFQGLFKDDVGKIPGYKGHIQLKPGMKPLFKPPRPLPYSLKDKVEDEIDRLENEGILTKISYSEWGTPVVPIIKPDGTVRLCADYKVTVNRAVENCSFPIPRTEDIFASIGKGKIFTTLDIKQAYLNVEMDNESAMIQAISTTKGIYRVNRLMFGVKMAPAIWQEKISMILAGLEGVHAFYDDIIVDGKNLEEHNLRLRKVLQRLLENNLRVNWKKCKFFESKVEYLGHVISREGISKCADKVAAVRDAPRPQSVAELRSWLGLVNYYGKFIKNLAMKLSPLYKLLEKGSKFIWTEKAESSFNQIKLEVISEQTLIAYDPDLPLILATDASPVGLGAVLSHTLPDGTERPICFASRCLSAAEKNYSQIDKEATAIYWALHKFFRFCYGRRFTLITDHKPLVMIFSPNKELPTLSAHRLLRYALFMQGFDYEIEYKPTNQHGNADALSRLPLKNTIKNDFQDETTLYHLEQISQLPVSFEEIQKETEADEELSLVLDELLKGKPISEPKYGNQSQELSTEQKCLFRGTRVIIPRSLRKRVLEELHSAHVGMSKMKGLARGYVWWPQIDSDIENIVRSCQSCLQFQREPPKTINHPWEEPREPFQRVHIDHAGPFKGQYFLLIIDAYTKWLEVFPVRNVTSQVTIERLRETFSRFGLPVTLVSDNGTAFTSNEFKIFLKENGINHRTIAPYHPSSNGQAERYVQTLKRALLKMMGEKGTLNMKLSRFLIANRRAPHSTTGKPPAELMLGRNIKTRLDLIRPSDIDKTVRKEEEIKVRTFQPGDSVVFRVYNNKGQKWSRGIIKNRLGRVIYIIQMEDGSTTKRHVDQLRSRQVE